jgi:hypothetical protein
MSGIHQMQISFVPAQDRLLFLLLTQDNNEFKFWFTRRYTKILWALLQHGLARDTPAPAPTPLHQQAILSFQHEQAVADADFKTPYKPPASPANPLGEEPILAAKAALRPVDTGKYTLSIHPEQGKGIDLNLDNKMLHALAKLLTDALRHSDWDLNYRLESPFPPPDKHTIN